jgi:uncharacterized protein YeaC (DUF1315 family)
MAYKPKPLGYKANAALEDVMSWLKNIERATAEAQQATIDNKPLVVMKVLSDIRTQAMLSHSTIVEARAGKFAE